MHAFIMFFSDQIADRGEKLELLVDKTEDLSANVRIDTQISLCLAEAISFSIHLKYIEAVCTRNRRYISNIVFSLFLF